MISTDSTEIGKQVIQNVKDLARQCKADPELSRELQKDAVSVLRRHNILLNKPEDNVTIKVLQDTGKVMHFTMPPPPQPMGKISDADMRHFAGGVEASSFGSVASFSTFGSVPSTASSGGTVGSASSAAPN